MGNVTMESSEPGPELWCTGPPYVTWVEGIYNDVWTKSPVVGIDKDGGSLYVGRAMHGGHLLPAKVAPTHQGAFVAWKGREISKYSSQYQVMVVSRGHVDWVKASDGAIPAYAFPVGMMVDGEIAYVARVSHDGTVTPGRLLANEGSCHISYDGLELEFDTYEVLVIT